MPGSAKERSVLLLPLEARGGMPAVLGRHEVAVSNSGRRRLQPWGGEGLRGRPMVRVPNPSLGWLDWLTSGPRLEPLEKSSADQWLLSSHYTKTMQNVGESDS